MKRELEKRFPGVEFISSDNSFGVYVRSGNRTFQLDESLLRYRPVWRLVRVRHRWKSPTEQDKKEQLGVVVKLIRKCLNK